ncbi:hypothetical protein ACJX0J_005432, partial [Zea mays]
MHFFLIAQNQCTWIDGSTTKQTILMQGHLLDIENLLQVFYDWYSLIHHFTLTWCNCLKCGVIIDCIAPLVSTGSRGKAVESKPVFLG